MSEELNPYAPPSSENAAPPPKIIFGWHWKIVQGRLLARDGAVLPNVCILSGASDRLGLKTFLRRQPFLSWHSREVIKVQVFMSHRSSLMNLALLVAGPILGCAAGIASSAVMIGDGSATAASLSVSITLICLGLGSMLFLHARKSPRIATGVNLWHEIRGVHPSAITLLQEIQEHHLGSDMTASFRE
jgi:hypothetical protein